MKQNSYKRSNYLRLGITFALVATFHPMTHAESSKSSREQPTSPSKVGLSTEQKIDIVLENQEKILIQLEQILEELKIVKVRATMR